MNISSSERVVNVVLLIVNRRDGFLIDELFVLFIPFMELTDPIQSIIMGLDMTYLAYQSSQIYASSVKGKVDFPQIGFEKGTTERGFSKVSKSV